MKNLHPLFAVVLLPIVGYFGWHSLTDLQHGSLMSAISRCSQDSMKHQGAERIRTFVAALDAIRPGPVSREVRTEFEHYKALWHAGLSTYDKTGSFGDYDMDIATSAKKLENL
jgi:hypothetical protein